MQLYTKDGKPVEVPDDQAADAIASGQFGAPRGAQVPVSWDGQVGTVPVENLPAAVGGGARVASQQELAQAQRQDYLEKEYGGTLGTAAATGLGFADTATFGIAPAVGGALGGEGARKYIREVQEAHPTATTVGQVGGVIAPIVADVATGGLATPAVAGSVARIGARGAEALELARAAELAKAGSGIVKGAEAAAEVSRLTNPTILERAGQVLAAPQRAMSEIGSVGEKAARAVLGEGAASLPGQLVQEVGSLAARGAVEGGAIGGLQSAKDQMLSEKPGISGEKILAAVGHGAVLGGLLGGGLGAAGVTKNALVRAAAPLTERVSENALVSLLKNERFSPGSALRRDKEFLSAAERELGPDALPQLARLLRKDVLKAGQTGEEFAQSVSRGRVAAEKALNDEFAALDLRARQVVGGAEIRQGPSAASVRDAIDEVFPQGRLGDGAPGNLDTVRSKLDTLAASKEAPIPKGTVVRSTREMTDQEIKDLIKADPKDQRVQDFRASNGRVRPTVEVESAPLKADLANPGDGRLTFSEASQVANRVLELAESSSGVQRERLLSLYEKVMAPTEEAAFNARARGASADALSKGVAEALSGKKGLDVAGSQARQVAEAEFRAGSAMQAVRAYRFADRYAQKISSAAKAPEGLGLEAVGAAGAVGSAVLGGGFLKGGLKGVAAKLAWDFAKKRGTSTAAVVGDAVSQVAATERAVAKFNRELDSRVNSIFEQRVGDLKPKIGEVNRLRVDKALGKDAAVRAQAGEKVAVIEREIFEKNRDQLLKWVTDVAAYERNMEALAARVPSGVASSVQQASLRTLNYLMQEMPKPQVDPSDLNPNRDKYPIPDGDQSRWNRQYRIAMNPLTYVDRIADGTLTPHEIRAMQACHPEIKADADARIAAKAAKKGQKPPSLAAEQSIRATLKLPQVNPSVTAVFNSKQDFGDDRPHGSGGGFSGGARGSGAGFKGGFSASYSLRGRGKSSY